MQPLEVLNSLKQDFLLESGEELPFDSLCEVSISTKHDTQALLTFDLDQLLRVLKRLQHKTNSVEVTIQLLIYGYKSIEVSDFDSIVDSILFDLNADVDTMESTTCH